MTDKDLFYEFTPERNLGSLVLPEKIRNQIPRKPAIVERSGANAMKLCPPCNQDCNQGRTCPARTRLRDLAVGDVFVLLRSNKRFVLERVHRTAGVGVKYFCRELSDAVQLHHSVHVMRVEQPPPPDA